MSVDYSSVLAYGIDLGDSGKLSSTLDPNGESEFLICNIDDLIYHVEGEDYRVPAGEKYPVDVATYGNGYGVPSVVLCVPGTQYSVNFGYDATPVLREPVVTSERLQKFQEWVESHGFEYKEPQWFLAGHVY